MGNNLALFVASYEDKGHPACSHHSARKHANLSFPNVSLTLPKHDIARLPPFFQQKQRSERVQLCVVRHHLDIEAQFPCSKNQEYSLGGEQSGLFVPP